MPRTATSKTRTGSGALPSVEEIKRLQNRVRGVINYFPPGEKRLREGVDEGSLKRYIREVAGPAHASRITLRKQRPGRGADPEYALAYDGELLFRLVFVRWPSEFTGHFGRWHVRRHPEATWWRREGHRTQVRHKGGPR